VKPPRWLDRRALLLLHAETLAQHGGLPGWRDEGVFDAALARPRHVHAYEPAADLARFAAAYGFGLVRNHPFNDGNKRTGFLAIGLCLALNGVALSVDQVDAVETINRLAAGSITEPQLAGWIRDHMVRGH
jgi:death on curing protein